MAQLPCIGLSWPLAKRHLLGVAIAIYFHYGVTAVSLLHPCAMPHWLSKALFWLVSIQKKIHFNRQQKNVSKTTKSANGRNKRGGFPTFVRIAPLSGRWFRTFFIFTPNPGEMIKFDFCICFNWGWWKTTFWGVFLKTNNVCVPLFAGLKPPTSCTLTLFFPKLRNSHTSQIHQWDTRQKSRSPPVKRTVTKRRDWLGRP